MSDKSFDVIQVCLPDFSKLNRFATVDELTKMCRVVFEALGASFDEQLLRQVIETDGVENVVECMLQSSELRPSEIEATLARMRGRLS